MLSPWEFIESYWAPTLNGVVKYTSHSIFTIVYVELRSEYRYRFSLRENRICLDSIGHASFWSWYKSWHRPSISFMKQVNAILEVTHKDCMARGEISNFLWYDATYIGGLLSFRLPKAISTIPRNVIIPFQTRWIMCLLPIGLAQLMPSCVIIWILMLYSERTEMSWILSIHI